MQGRPQDYMTVGIVHYLAFPETLHGDGPVAETVARICRDGYFGAIEVTHVRDAGARRAAIESATAAGCAVFFSANPVLLQGQHDLNAVEPARWRKAADAARACLAEAREWSARRLILMSGPDVAADKRHLAKGLLVSALKTVCETSRRQGRMPVALEAFDRQPFGQNRLIGPVPEAIEVARQVQPFYGDFGLALDLAHLTLMGESSEGVLKSAAPWLTHVRIGNCVTKDTAHAAYGDSHPSFGCDGGDVGVAELAEFLKALLAIGYLREGGVNPVSFAIKPHAGVPSAQVLENAQQTLNAAWARV